MLEGKFDVKEFGCSSELAKEMLFTLPVSPESGEICLVYRPLLGVMGNKNDRRKYLRLCHKFEVGPDSCMTIEYNERIGRFSLKRDSKENDFMSSCGQVCLIKARVDYDYATLRNRFLRKAFDLGYAVEYCSLNFRENMILAELGRKPGSARLFLNSGEFEERRQLEDWFDNLLKKYNPVKE